MKALTDMPMIVPDPTDDEIRAYAAGTMDWADMRDRGVTYDRVLAGLGKLGLRPPYAPMVGPNVEARRRGVAFLREAFGSPPDEP